MAPSNGEELTNHTPGGWWQSTNNWGLKYEAASSDTTNAVAADRYYRFKDGPQGSNASNGTAFRDPATSNSDTDNNNRHSIKFFYNTGVWADGSTLNDPNYFTSTSTNASTTSVSGYPQALYIWNNTTLNASFDLSSHSWASPPSQAPTVTEITIAKPPYSHSDGVNTITVEGEIVSNDVIVASDVTLYKDFQAYANSNLTLVANKFQITKSGTGMYTIECGGKSNSFYWADESWLNNINANSSTRSNNSTRIKDVIAKIPDSIQLYHLDRWETPAVTGVPDARGPSTTGWLKFDDQPTRWVKDRSTTWVSYTRHWSAGSKWQTEPYKESHVFQLEEINGEICWRWYRHKWFDDYSLNHSLSGAIIASPWHEVGAHPHPVWYYTWDPNSTRNGVSNHDPWAIDEDKYVLANDWIYYQEPEGDDQGPDGNPPWNTPPGNKPPTDPPTDPDPPKNQYPGDNYPRRRRAHSFW